MTTSRSTTDLPTAPVVIAFRTPVRGHAFAAPPPDAGPLEIGMTLLLQAEPTNPADPLAIAVWTGGERPWRIGYLDRGVAARLSPRLCRGDRLAGSLDGWWDAPGGWKRPVVALTIQPDPAKRGAPRAWGVPPRSVTRAVRRDDRRSRSA